MAGQVVLIEFIPDPEARRAANSLAVVLRDARWDVRSIKPNNGDLKDGVSIQPSSVREAIPKPGPPPDGSPDWITYRTAPWMRGRAAGEKLLNFLHSYNWQAQFGFPLDEHGKMIRDEAVLPAGAIRIQIGLNPATEYVPPSPRAEYDARLKEYEQERSTETRRRHEASFVNLPPEERKKALRRLEEADAQM
jgi:hypothetical protein